MMFCNFFSGICKIFSNVYKIFSYDRLRQIRLSAFECICCWPLPKQGSCSDSINESTSSSISERSATLSEEKYEDTGFNWVSLCFYWSIAIGTRWSWSDGCWYEHFSTFSFVYKLIVMWSLTCALVNSFVLIVARCIICVFKSVACVYI